MVEPKLQLFLIVISFLFASFIFVLVKKETLELKYTLVWIFTGIILIIISLQPKIVTFASIALGIGLPVNALFLFGILFTLIILLTVTIAISRALAKIRRLTQEVAILKFELSQYKKEAIKS